MPKGVVVTQSNLSANIAAFADALAALRTTSR